LLREGREAEHDGRPRHHGTDMLASCQMLQRKSKRERLFLAHLATKKEHACAALVQNNLAL